jgi:hypothetical protein
MVWTGGILSGLVVVMLLFSGIMKLMKPASWRLPARTAGVGAILLTGCLGGATATHVRIDDPWVKLMSER